MAPFSNEVKQHVREKQASHCLVCGKECRLEIHHCVCENGLKPIGIKGKNIEENAVGVCNKNEGNCHTELDRLAIQEHLFFKDGKLVQFSEIDPKQYEMTKRVNIDELGAESINEYKEKRRKKREKREERRLIKQIKEMGYKLDPRDINADVNFRRT